MITQIMYFILVGIDPLDQPGVNSIYKFSTREETIQFLNNWIQTQFQKLFNKSERIKNNLKLAKEKYIEHFNTYNYIHFHETGFAEQNSSLQYDYKWSLHIL